jgi:hypothetical protein
MEFKDYDLKVYYKTLGSWTPSTIGWNDYIKSLNLGIEFIPGITDLNISYHLYKIVDEKKWLLTKLKYGI